MLPDPLTLLESNRLKLKHPESKAHRADRRIKDDFCILQVSYEKPGGSYKKLPSKTTKTLRKRFDPCRYVEEVKVIKCPQIPKRKIQGPQTDLSDAFWACSASPINKTSLHSYHASTITDTK